MGRRRRDRSPFSFHSRKPKLPKSLRDRCFFDEKQRLTGLLILFAASIPYNFGQPLVGRSRLLEKVAEATQIAEKSLFFDINMKK